MALTPSTELEAVNVILDSIGEAPVAALDVTGLSDAALARTKLAEASRAVQARGWEFNREVEYPMARNLSNEIVVPADALFMDVAKSEYRRGTLRGTRLYDLENRTYAWDRDIKVDMIRLLEFTDLPEAARYYITVRAARLFARAALGSTTVERFTQDDEARAWAELLRMDTRAARRNIYNGSTGRDLDRASNTIPEHLWG